MSLHYIPVKGELFIVRHIGSDKSYRDCVLRCMAVDTLTVAARCVYPIEEKRDRLIERSDWIFYPLSQQFNDYVKAYCEQLQATHPSSSG
jgi:hypothetical protein